ncbi:citrate synthase [Microlunatus soli]|uniref:citrate synthase (unknown stereospecificity) n=1 Tax=Microlunatus soli TaxID=630515 RepID=A0A1H1WRU6_9ACTN|nr:citrate synthase [Microlunatus soli]SDS99390.1 citrate synthase [Microlunatus soli]
MNPTRLTAAETAARLGVKPETLYAYVSRGLLGRERGPSGSSFDPLEVERFAASRRRGADRSPVQLKDGRPIGGPLMTIDTEVALIEDDELYYRGRPVADLVGRYRFEAVCHWVWRGGLDDAVRFRPLPDAVERVIAVFAALPPETALDDRIRIAVPVIAGADPLREDRDPQSVAHRAGAMMITLAAALAGGPEQTTVAGCLAAALTAPDSAIDHDQLVGLLDTALVLLIDHDLAVSTLAARAAASARANPYAVVGSALGALDSGLHGRASVSAYRMLAAVANGTPATEVIAATIAAGVGGVPGFGHRIYTAVDPRAELIFARLAELSRRGVLPDACPALAAAEELVAVLRVHSGGFGNVDLALAALALAFGMPAEAGSVIFAIARIGGWIAHALDEYRQPALRLRPIGRYVGP